MADITPFPFVRHLRAETSSHILHYKDARLVHSGRGLSFWFSPMSASLAEVPVDDRELTLLVHGRSADFQDVAVQGVVTFRVVDVVRLAERVDFSIDLRTGRHLKEPLDALATLVSQLAQQHAWTYLARAPVREILGEGQERVRARIDEGFAHEPALTEMGLAIVSVRVSSIKPKPELEKALEAPMRERIQEQTDEAAFARRALAVENERAIRENELQNQIALAKREEELIVQKGQNGRKQAEEEAAAERISTQAGAERSGIDAEAAAIRVRFEADATAMRTRTVGGADAASLRDVEGARADVERARMEVYRTLPPAVLFGLAAQELAKKLKTIEHLNLSPEILGPMLTSLMSAGTRRLEGQEPR